MKQTAGTAYPGLEILSLLRTPGPDAATCQGATWSLHKLIEFSICVMSPMSVLAAYRLACWVVRIWPEPLGAALV